MKISGILFDLEGVLLRGKTHEVLPGATALFEYCRQSKLPFGIVTNNTMHAPSELLGLLRDRGLKIQPQQLHTPLQFLSLELQSVQTALVIGSPGLEQFVKNFDVEIQDSPEVDAVILGGSYRVSNDNLNAAFTAITKHGSRFYCLHRNKTFNDAQGVNRPDVGCLVVGLEYSTGRSAKTLGKPSAEFFAKAIENWQVVPSEILLISDDPVSDLPGGKAMGFQTAFVSTGKYSMESIDGLSALPDYSWPDLPQCQELLMAWN